MECERCREAISARLDGELEMARAAAVDAHLAGCPACASFEESAARVNRVLRMRVADEAPDLSGAIVARIGPAPAPSRRRTAVRVGLAAVAVAQLLFAVPALVGADHQMAHVGRELASWHLALGAGFLVVAWQPVRALGLLPVVAVVAAALGVTAAVDVAGGHATAMAESRHVVELVGVGLLWLVARGVSGFRRVSG